MQNFIKKPVFIISAGIIVVIVAGSIYFSRDKTVYDFILATKRDIVQEVSVTGRVKPTEAVDLAFEKTGRVAHIYIKIGNKVSVGQLLIALENADLRAQLAQAEANLKEQQAGLTELKAGFREEEVRAKQIELNKAKQDLTDYYIVAVDALNDAYSKAEEAVRIKTEPLFIYGGTSNPFLTFNTTDSHLETIVRSSRVLSENKLNKWKKELADINKNSTPELIEQSLKNVKDYLIIFREFLSQTTAALEKNIGISSSIIEVYRSNLNAAQTSIGLIINDINDKSQKISSQKLTINKLEEELNLKLAGSTSEQIIAQEARVEQAQANILNYQAQLAKTILRSPIAGIVTKQEAKVGEIVSANINIVSVISAAKFEIEADIYEEDVVKINVGNLVEISLVAFPREKFSGRVISISPAEKIIDGVVYYEAIIDFEEAPDGIKSTMTADIIIRSDTKENALTVPRSVIQRREGKTIVEVLENNLIQEKEIEIGIRGVNDMVEILSGLEEGEKIIQR